MERSEDVIIRGLSRFSKNDKYLSANRLDMPSPVCCQNSIAADIEAKGKVTIKISEPGRWSRGRRGIM